MSIYLTIYLVIGVLLGVASVIGNMLAGSERAEAGELAILVALLIPAWPVIIYLILQERPKKKGT